jgi:hypothetical protein
MLTGLGDVIGRLRTLSYDYEHQRCDARHVHAELRESADAAVPDKELPR